MIVIKPWWEKKLLFGSDVESCTSVFQQDLREISTILTHMYVCLLDCYFPLNRIPEMHAMCRFGHRRTWWSHSKGCTEKCPGKLPYNLDTEINNVSFYSGACLMSCTLLSETIFGSRFVCSFYIDRNNSVSDDVFFLGGVIAWPNELLDYYLLISVIITLIK